MKKPFSFLDRKNSLVYAFWNSINKAVLRLRFKKLQIIGRNYLPESGPFILVSNHISRWDGLVVYKTIGRPSNFMVSPNELSGIQGKVLISMGAFPALGRADLFGFCRRQMEKGEGIVIFPEGDIYNDGSTHIFKNGAARIALLCASAGLDIPLVPCAIRYAAGGKIAQISLGQAVQPRDYLGEYRLDSGSALRTLSERLRREVCFLRYGLGNADDRLLLFFGKQQKIKSALATPAAVAGKAL